MFTIYPMNAKKLTKKSTKIAARCCFQILAVSRLQRLLYPGGDRRLLRKTRERSHSLRTPWGVFWNQSGRKSGRIFPGFH